MNWSCLWLYWDNWGNINLRNFMESRLLFLIIIMMIEILPAVFIKYHCCSIYKILANSLQWLLCKDISVSAIIYYFFTLSLWSHFNVSIYLRTFQLISFQWTRLATFSITFKAADFCHNIDLELLLETLQKPNSEGRRHRVSTKSVAWGYELFMLVFLNPNYIPLALQ